VDNSDNCDLRTVTARHIRSQSNVSRASNTYLAGFLARDSRGYSSSFSPPLYADSSLPNTAREVPDNHESDAQFGQSTISFLKKLKAKMDDHTQSMENVA